MKALFVVALLALGLGSAALSTQLSAAPADAKKTDAKKPEPQKSEVDLAYDAFNKLRDKPGAQYDSAEFDAFGRAGIEFLKTYPTHRRAPGVVKSMAEYDRKISAPNKEATQAKRAMYGRQVGLLLTNEPSDLAPPVQAALTALRAAMAGVVARADSSNRESIMTWSQRLDQLQALEAAEPFLADQMIALYYFLDERRAPTAEGYLNKLLTHSSPSVVARAKEEAALLALKKNPLELAFTATNGTAFSAEAIRGKKILVVHFFTVKSTGPLTEINQICSARRKNVEVIGICLSPKESAADVAKLLSENNIKWLVQHDGDGKNHPLAVALGVRDTTSTVIFKMDGHLHARGVWSGKLASQLDSLAPAKSK